jgi:hypothetical protein
VAFRRLVAGKVVYLFDADLKGVGYAICEVREDSAVVGSARSGIADTTDEKWIPEAGQRGLIVIRRDTDVLKPGTEERRLWERHRCRGFVLAIKQPTLWEEFAVLVRAWDNMENHIRDRGRETGWVAKILRPARVAPG